MSGFTLKKKTKTSWTSQPFYIHPQGYKMCLTVDANGDGEGEGEGTHISVFTELMHGEFDSQLNWPFEGFVNIMLFDQEGDEHKTYISIYDEDTPDICKYPAINDKNTGWGDNCFLAHTRTISKYVKHDSLCFSLRVSC